MASLNNKDKIAIEFGEPVEVIHVSKNRLTGDSEFFRAALKPEWNDKADGPPIIDLRDEDPEVVKVYIRYLSSNKYEPTKVKRTTDTHWKFLFDLYIWGDKILSAKFCNLIMFRISKFHDVVCEEPGVNQIKMAYTDVPDGSPLRKIVVDVYAQKGNPWSMLTQLFSEVNCEDFAKDLNETLEKGRHLSLQWPKH